MHAARNIKNLNFPFPWVFSHHAVLRARPVRAACILDFHQQIFVSRFLLVAVSKCSKKRVHLRSGRTLQERFAASLKPLKFATKGHIPE